MFHQELDFNSNTFRETPRKKGGLYFYTKRKIKNELKLFHPPPPHQRNIHIEGVYKNVKYNFSMITTRP